MHLLVLSAFRRKELVPQVAGLDVSMHLLVLSAFRPHAQSSQVLASSFQCTFWCSVLSDAPTNSGLASSFSSFNAPSGAQCFPTLRFCWLVLFPVEFQCTFWCSVLSDLGRTRPRMGTLVRVSMHLLVLSAFRRTLRWQWRGTGGFNAPSGAQCFPTPPPENRATTPFTGTKSPPTWKAPHRIGPHLSN